MCPQYLFTQATNQCHREALVRESPPTEMDIQFRFDIIDCEHDIFDVPQTPFMLPV